MLMVSDALIFLQHVGFSAGESIMRAGAATVNDGSGFKSVPFPEPIDAHRASPFSSVSTNPQGVSHNQSARRRSVVKWPVLPPSFQLRSSVSSVKSTFIHLHNRSCRSTAKHDKNLFDIISD